MWHLEKGFWVGWKQLPDTRIIFTIITILAFFYYFFEKYKKSIYNFIISCFAYFNHVGERKALLVFIILFLVRYSPGISVKTIFLFLIYLMLNVLNTFIENPYINNKIDNILNILNW